MSKTFHIDGRKFQIVEVAIATHSHKSTPVWFVDEVIPCDGYEATKNLYSAPSYDEAHAWLVQ
jgi:hypothetical protein